MSAFTRSNRREVSLVYNCKTTPHILCMTCCLVCDRQTSLSVVDFTGCGGEQTPQATAKESRVASFVHHYATVVPYCKYISQFTMFYECCASCFSKKVQAVGRLEAL